MGEAWKTFNSITSGIGILRTICYMELGMSYRHFDSFHLSAFDMIAGQEQKPSIVMTIHPPLDDDPSSWVYWSSYLLECDGDLFLVYLSHCLHKLYVMKSDWLWKECVRVNNLKEGCEMFLGDISSF